ncbi:MAG TPA: tyrosine-type recombinase/integrase, partial [Stenomitos sp.]
MDIAARYKPKWSSKQFSFNENVADFVIRSIGEQAPSLSVFIEDLQKVVMLHPGVWKALNERKQSYVRHPRIIEPPYPNSMFFDVLGHLTSDRFFTAIAAIDKNDHFTESIYKLSLALRAIVEYETGAETVNHAASHKSLLSNLEIKRHQCPLYELIACPQPSPSVLRSRWQLLVLSVLKTNYSAFKNSQGTVILTEDVQGVCEQLIRLAVPLQARDQRPNIVNILSSEDHRTSLTLLTQKVSGLLSEFANEKGDAGEKESAKTLANLLNSLCLGRLNPVIAVATVEQASKIAETRKQVIAFLKNDPWTPRHSETGEHTPHGDPSQDQDDDQDAPADAKSDEIGFIAREIEFSVHRLECKYPFFDNRYLVLELKAKLAKFDNELHALKREVSRLAIWLSVELGWDALDVLSLTCRKTPGPTWSIDPTKEKLHRTCVRMTQNNVKYDSDFIYPCAEVEVITIPQELSSSTKMLKVQDSFSLGASNPGLYPQIAEDLMAFSKLVSPSRPATLRHSSRLLLTYESGNPTLAELQFTNHGSRLSSNCNYYSRICGTENVGGSRLFFKLDRLRISIRKLINKLKRDISSADPFTAWNAWNHYVQFALLLASGGRPVNAAFSEIADYYLQRGLLIINDKALFTRDSARVIMLPKTCRQIVESHLKNALPNLKEAITGRNKTTWQQFIDELILLDVGSTSLPLYFELNRDNKNWAPLRGANAVEILDVGDLPSNSLRHLISNHLELNDRELIDAMLGHQDEQLPTHGPTSARDLGSDLHTLAEATEVAMKRFDFELLEPPQFKSNSLSLGLPRTEIYGKEMRRQESERRHRELDLKSENYKPTKPISKFEWSELRNRIKLENTDDHAQIIGVVYNYIFKNNFAKDFSKYQTHAAQKAWFDQEDLKLLKTYDRSQQELIQLVHHHRNYHSTTDVRFLFCLSLILNNGLSSEKLLRIVWAMDVEHYQFDSVLWIELAIRRDEAGKIAEQVRLRMRQSSCEILTRYKNKKLGSIKLEARKEDISKKLKRDIVSIFGTRFKENFTSFELLAYIGLLQSTNQKLILPGALQAIAYSAIENRSESRSSLIGSSTPRNGSRTKDLDEPTIELHGKKIETGAMTDLLIKQINYFKKTTGDERYSLCPEFKNNEDSAITYLRNYVISVLKRTTNRRETLADSTIEDYLQRISNFITSTSIESDLKAGDLECIEETIQLYLSERAEVVERWDDDARQIQSFTSLNVNPDLANVHVPRMESSIRIRSTVIKDIEYENCLNKLVNQSSADCAAILILARKFGMRIGEIINLRTHALEMLSTTIRIEIRSNRYWRTKTCNSNRTVSPCTPLSSIERNLLITLKKSQSESKERFLFKRETISNNVAHLRSVLKEEREDLSIHSLRHTFATQLATAVLGANEVNSNQTQYVYATTTPKGRGKTTLFALSRKLGHGSSNTILQTYYHRGFRDIESYHFKLISNDDPIANDSAFKTIKINEPSPPQDAEEKALSLAHREQVLKLLVARCMRATDVEITANNDISPILEENNFLSPLIQIKFENFLKKFLSLDPRFWIRGKQKFSNKDRRIFFNSNYWKTLTGVNFIHQIDETSDAITDLWTHFTREKQFLIRTIEVKKTLENLQQLTEITGMEVRQMSYAWYSPTGADPTTAVLEIFKELRINL